MMFICENLEIPLWKRAIMMQEGSDLFKSISKFVVNNEGFPPQSIVHRKFDPYYMQLDAAERDMTEQSTECAQRFKWYNQWSFEKHEALHLEIPKVEELSSASTPNPSLSASPPPRPFSPLVEVFDDREYAIPSNQLAQKIPRLLDLEQPPSSSGNLSI